MVVQLSLEGCNSGRIESLGGEYPGYLNEALDATQEELKA